LFTEALEQCFIFFVSKVASWSTLCLPESLVSGAGLLALSIGILCGL
jgi:hypothetical protein